MEKALASNIISTARMMNSSGLNHGRSGNVSARAGNRVYITASACDLDRIEIRNLVEVDMDGNWSGPVKPSSELSFHLAIYQTRPDAAAVVHVHSPWATSLACLHREIPAFHYMVAMAGGDNVPCVPYAAFGTRELADCVAEGVRERDACLMANHGMVALGKDLQSAFELATEVEHLSRCYAQALAVGEPKLLSNEEMAQALARFDQYRKAARGDNSGDA